MRRSQTILSATALVLLGITGTLMAHEPQKKPAVAKPAASASDPVAAVLVRNAHGFETGDLAMLDTIWAGDDGVTVFESGSANYGWQDYRDHHLKPEIDAMKNVRYRLSDIKTRVSGNTAWATFKYALTADIRERHIDVAGLGTAVLEKRGSDWKIVHWHTSAPRSKPAEKKP
jgi:ketosteroid isomerase-like protein